MSYKKEKAVKYRAAHRDRIRESQRAWRAANREKIQTYKAVNRERILAYQQGYREANRDKLREHARLSRAANPEKFRVQEQARRDANREKLREQDRVRRMVNREKIRQRQNAWAQVNRQKLREQQRVYWTTHREKHRADQRKRRALRVQSSCYPVPSDGLQQRWDLYGGRCWMCGGEATHVDHVKPLSKGGAHILCNLRPACSSCNSRKRDRWPFATRVMPGVLGPPKGRLSFTTTS